MSKANYMVFNPAPFAKGAGRKLFLSSLVLAKKN